MECGIADCPIRLLAICCFTVTSAGHDVIVAAQHVKFTHSDAMNGDSMPAVLCNFNASFSPQPGQYYL